MAREGILNDKTMRITALRIAEQIIYLAKEHNKSVTNLDMQSILYHLWVEYYRDYEEYLFTDSFYAWRLGAVVPDVYYKYCIFTAHGLQRFYDFEEAPISDMELRNRIDSTIIDLLSLSTYDLYVMNTNWRAWQERRELDEKYSRSDREISFARIIALDVHGDNNSKID